ncbi:MAG: cysteine--tRNA ligase [Patescibacteria group bacterium]|nr:cysteine--tRNA ligase [Patescibacteria group bacterium]
MLKVYNTLTRKKEEFKPRKDKEVGIYTCGPTVYNHAHIGNLRAYVFADTLFRYLKFAGYKVKWVMNITDVDDKTIRDSKKAGVSLKEFTEKYEKLFFEDIEKLNINKKEFFKIPKATKYMKEMQELVKVLLDKEIAYIKDGSIYFNIQKYIDSGHKYGKLLKIDMANFKRGERVEADEYEKENVQDFVLWKAKKESNEPSWDFKIEGKNYPGRPGWHIECSAMSRKNLGNPFDIHTGGVDLIFPHHEDEIAQTEGAYDVPIANYFMHNEHLLVENQKMSKSLGNFYVLEDITKFGKPLAFRLLALQTHYREKLNFTKDSMLQAEVALTRVYEFIRKLLWVEKTGQKDRVSFLLKKVEKEFSVAIADDLSTPRALASLWESIAKINKLIDEGLLNKKEANLFYDFFLKIDRVLGLGLDEVLQPKIDPTIVGLINKYKKATVNKDYETKDKIRTEFNKLGYKIEDTKYGIPRITFLGEK